MVKNNQASSSDENVAKSLAVGKKQYKGVRMRSWGSWVSEIRAPNQKTRIWLGSYSTPEAAARAYDAALLCLKGSSANFNFPINPSLRIPSTLMSPKSIKRLAAAAAYAPTTSPSSSSTSSSSSFTSSPSLCSSTSSPSPYSPSSPLDYQDQLFTPCIANQTTCLVEDLSCFIDPWIAFDDLLSPKCIDQMLFEPSPPQEEYEEEDIRLWSFC